MAARLTQAACIRSSALTMTGSNSGSASSTSAPAAHPAMTSLTQWVPR